MSSCDVEFLMQFVEQVAEKTCTLTEAYHSRMHCLRVELVVVDELYLGVNFALML